jgi:hypothetical protein
MLLHTSSQMSTVLVVAKCLVYLTALTLPLLLSILSPSTNSFRVSQTESEASLVNPEAPLSISLKNQTLLIHRFLFKLAQN